MKAKIHVTLKQGILDPQGKAVEHALATLGYGAVSNVRVGKHIELEVDESVVSDAEAQVKAMCEKLLANTIIEEYAYELESDRPKPLPEMRVEPVVEITTGAAQPTLQAGPAERSERINPTVVTEAAPSVTAHSPPADAPACGAARPPEDTRARGEAFRLARRILSDIALLNPQAVEEGIRKGTFRQVMRDDLDEGLRLFHQQVPEEICAGRDYFEDAIEDFISDRKAGLRKA